MVSGKGLGRSASWVCVCPKTPHSQAVSGQSKRSGHLPPHGWWIPTTAKCEILPLSDFSGPYLGTPRAEVMLKEWCQGSQERNKGTINYVSVSISLTWRIFWTLPQKHRQHHLREFHASQSALCPSPTLRIRDRYSSQGDPKHLLKNFLFNGGMSSITWLTDHPASIWKPSMPASLPFLKVTLYSI